MKTYINNVLPKKVSDLVDDSGHYTKPSGGIPASDLADGVIPVEDVQVNGTSVVTDGVAEIPVASASGFGTVKGGDYGVKIGENGNLKGVLVTDYSSESTIKGGASYYKPITPRYQHAAVFYGLAKAAGADMNNSSNAVGTYTDEAKSAIQNMLDVPNADDVVTEVKINDVSVVTDGVAEIPIAGSQTPGVIKVLVGDHGVQVSSNGILQIASSKANDIKAGTQSFRPIAPNRQHESTFYGLAKAAGDTTQSASSNAVGTYTDEAKAAIKSMLDVRDGDLSVGTVTTLPSTENAAAEITGDYTAMTLNLGLPRGKSGVYIGAEPPTD